MRHYLNGSTNVNDTFVGAGLVNAVLYIDVREHAR